MRLPEIQIDLLSLDMQGFNHFTEQGGREVRLTRGTPIAGQSACQSSAPHTADVRAQKMKTNATIALLLMVITGACGCDGPRRITSAEFSSQYELGNMQTMKQADYLGTLNSNAYIRIRTMSTISPKKWNEEIVYAPLKELPPELQAALIDKSMRYEGKRKE